MRRHLKLIICFCVLLNLLALLKYSEHNIDLLLTDVIMTGQDGPELALTILRENPSLKVLFMSGYAPDTFQHFFDGMTGYTYIHKPFDSAALEKSIRGVLDSDNTLSRA